MRARDTIMVVECERLDISLKAKVDSSGYIGKVKKMSAISNKTLSGKKKPLSGSKNSSPAASVRKSNIKRELINNGKDGRYIRSDAKGCIDENDNVGRSLIATRRAWEKSYENRHKR